MRRIAALVIGLIALILCGAPGSAQVPVIGPSTYTFSANGSNIWTCNSGQSTFALTAPSGLTGTYTVLVGQAFTGPFVPPPFAFANGSNAFANTLTNSGALTVNLGSNQYVQVTVSGWTAGSAQVSGVCSPAVAVAGFGPVTAGANIVVANGANAPIVSTTAAPTFTGVSLSGILGAQCVGTNAGGTLTTNATCGGGTTSVQSVSASAPIASSGGANPNISFTGTLPIANGGTGTASPTGVACGPSGNMICSGGFPSQTVDVTETPTFHGVAVKTMPEFNAAAYGTLDPTGATDSSPAINAAMAACTSAGGGVVFIPANPAGGTAVYLMDSHIAPASNCWLVGAGRDLVTLRAGNTSLGAIIYNGLTNSLSNIKVSGITFDANNELSQDAVAIAPLTGSDIRVTDDRFINLNQARAVALGNIFDAPGCSNSGCVGPTLSSVAGGTLAATTYYVKVTYLDGTSGESQQSLEGSLAVAANNLLTVSCPVGALGNQAYATACHIYVSTATNTETRQDTVTIAPGTLWTEPTTGLIAGASYGGYSTYLKNVAVKNNLFVGGVNTMGGAEVCIIVGSQRSIVSGNTFSNFFSTLPDSMLAFYGYDDFATASHNIFDNDNATTPISTALAVEGSSQNVISADNHYIQTSLAAGSEALWISNSAFVSSVGDVVTSNSAADIGLSVEGDFTGTTFDTNHLTQIPDSHDITLSGDTMTGTAASYAQIGTTAAGLNYAQYNIAINGGSMSGVDGCGIQYSVGASTGMTGFSVTGVTFGNMVGGSGTICVLAASGKPFSNVHFNDNVFLQSGYYAFYLDGTNAANAVTAVGNDFTNLPLGNDFDLVNGATVNTGATLGTAPITATLAANGSTTVACPTCVSGLTAGSNIVVGSGTSPSVAVTAAPTFAGAASAYYLGSQADGSGSGTNTTFGPVAPCYTASGGSCVGTQHMLNFSVSIPSSPAPYTCTEIGTTAVYECTTSDQTWQTVTLAGGAIFSSASSYSCIGEDIANSGAQPVWYSMIPLASPSASGFKMVAPPFLSTASTVTTGGTLNVKCWGS